MMADVSIRNLRNKGRAIVDRAAAGARIVITRDGTPVAELIPLKQQLSTAQLTERWKHLPPMDPDALRHRRAVRPVAVTSARTPGARS